MGKVRDLNLDLEMNAEVTSALRPSRPIAHHRSPWVVTTKNWLYGREKKVIALWVNPLSVSWSLPRREQMTKTAAGVVRNTWRNRYRNTYYDEFTLDITFQSGSILPYVSLPEGDLHDYDKISGFFKKPTPPPGLQDFYRFLSLVDQPMLAGTSENYHILFYRSRIFPRLRLEGYFIGTTPIAFSDDAASNANHFTWTSTFQVYRTVPAINNYRLLENEWSSWAKAQAMGEVLPFGTTKEEIQQMIASYEELAEREKILAKRKADQQAIAAQKAGFTGFSNQINLQGTRITLVNNNARRAAAAANTSALQQQQQLSQPLTQPGVTVPSPGPQQPGVSDTALTSRPS